MLLGPSPVSSKNQPLYHNTTDAPEVMVGIDKKLGEASGIQLSTGSFQTLKNMESSNGVVRTGQLGQLETKPQRPTLTQGVWSHSPVSG